MKEMPANSHFVADAFITFSSLDDLIGEKRLTHWGWMDHYTYICLTKGSTLEQVEENRDTLAEVVLNEAAVQQMLITQPIGQLVTGQVKGKVVGVIENFNCATLHAPIEPMIPYSYPPNFRFVLTRKDFSTPQNTINRSVL